VRRRPAYRNHVWAYDFVDERTHDGRALRLLTVVDGKLRDELLDREMFYTLAEAQILTEWWRQEYNHLRPTARSATGRRLPRPSPRCRCGPAPVPFQSCLL
jgi:hypothetical protein